MFAVVGSVVLFQSRAATSTTYYVSTTGSDSANGSASAPWKTIQKGITSLSAGDTLIVRGGTYSESITSPSISKGTASARITVKAATGEQPLIKGFFWLSGADYWTLDNIDVTYPTGDTSGKHMMKMTSGTGWRITNSEIYGARGYAGLLVAGTPSNWMVDHNYFHDTYDVHGSNQDHLIYINGGTGGGTVTRNIFKTSPNGRGVKIGPPSGGSSPISNVTISYNTFYDNTGPSNIQLSYGASNNKIFRNIMVKSSTGNINGYNLNGSGNEAYDNVGWDSSAVITHNGSTTKIADKGGNIHEDPQLDLNTFKVGNSKFSGYGRFAPGDDNTGGLPGPVPTPTGDTQAPTAPTNVQANAVSQTEVDLSWTASTDNTAVTGYTVYRSDSTAGVKVGPTTSYIDGNVKAGTTYNYQLEAFDAAGNKSAKSAAVSVTTPAPTPNPTPSDTTAPTVTITAPTNGSTVSGSVAVSANATDNVGVAKVEFRVDGALKSTDTSSPYGFIWDTTSLVGSHTLEARAVDAAGNASIASVTVTTNTTPPPSTTLGAPANLTAKVISGTQINLYWNTAPTYRVDIYRDGVKVGSTSSDSKYGDTYKLQPGTSYKYYVIARDEAGNVSAHSATVTAKTSGGSGSTSSSSLGTLTGKVSNTSGGAISGAKVSIKVNGKTVSATTNSSGIYTLVNQPADSYPIVYAASGYNTKNDNVTILAGVVKTKNVTLSK